MKHIATYGFGILLSTSLLLGCGGGTPQQGESAPSFALTDLEGQQHALEQYRGKLIMLYFWTDNCDICKREFPLVQQYYEEFQREDAPFEILAIYVGVEEDASKTFRETYGVTFPMLTDDAFEVIKAYNISATPTNYLINPQGKIARRIVGFLDKQQISSLLYNIQMNAQANGH